MSELQSAVPCAAAPAQTFLESTSAVPEALTVPSAYTLGHIRPAMAMPQYSGGPHAQLVALLAAGAAGHGGQDDCGGDSHWSGAGFEAQKVRPLWLGQGCGRGLDPGGQLGPCGRGGVRWKSAPSSSSSQGH